MCVLLTGHRGLRDRRAVAERAGRALILATKPFEAESVVRSWFEVGSTFAAYALALAVTFASVPWPLRAISAVAAGLIQFRMFALFHAHLHRALLWDSSVAQWLFRGLGLFMLVPRSVWMQTHRFHHVNNGKIDWTSIGSYAVWTREQFARASPWSRRAYLLSRHPMKMLLGYVFVGIGGMCLHAFIRTPTKNWTGPLALALHFGGAALLGQAFGPVTAALIWVVPCAVNHALASYLFYAQHNFPGTRFFASGDWDYTRAALVGSSYFRMGPLMRWMTADIGYHHVHHVNHRIPTYRAAAAMAAIPELQSPTTTSWRPQDVWACLQLTFWNPQTRTMEPASLRLARHARRTS